LAPGFGGRAPVCAAGFDVAAFRPKRNVRWMIAAVIVAQIC
jgi:hypothetical protein